MRLKALVLTTALLAAPISNAKVPKDMSERAITTLLHGAQSADFGTRANAISGLAYGPKKRVLTVIKDALGDQQWQVRRAVIMSLVRLRDRSWEDAISNAMLSSNLDAGTEVFPLLKPLGTKKALRVMRKAFENPKMPQPHRYVEVLAAEGKSWLVKGFQMGLKLKQKQAREAFEEALPKLRLPDAGPLYKKVLPKQSVAIQKAVVARLSKAENAGDLSFVKRLLKSKDGDVRFQVAVALANQGDPAGRKLLLKALEGKSEARQLAALRALKHVAGKDLFPLLQRYTRDDKVSAELLGATLEIHASLKNRKLGPWLEKRLTGNLVRSIAVQAAAVSVLGRVKGKAALPTLYKLTSHGDPRVRKSVARSLADLGRRESIPKIAEALFNESQTDVKVALIEALSAINSIECLDVLRTELASPNQDVLEAVVKALAKVRHAQTVPDLEIVLQKARSMKLRRLAVIAILRLGPTRYVRHFKQAMTWLTAADMRELTREHKREMIPNIQEALKSSRPLTRKAGLAALEELDPKTRSELYRRLAIKDKRPDMRIAGLRAIVSLEGKKAADVCSALATDSDKSVRVVALEAVGKLGGKGAQELLFKATNDVDEKIRVAAAASLLRL